MNTLKNMDYIDDYMKRHLTEKRLRHTNGVHQEAIRLADKYGANPEKAALAAKCHDLFRSLRGEDLYQTVQELGLDVERYGKNPNLAHGKIAAILMQRDLGIDDAEVLNAVSYHTTGRAGMTLLEKIVFLADAIEPNRAYPGVDTLRILADQDLDSACLFSLESTANHVRAQGEYLDVDTLSAIEYFKELKKNNG